MELILKAFLVAIPAFRKVGIYQLLKEHFKHGIQTFVAYVKTEILFLFALVPVQGLHGLGFAWIIFSSFCYSFSALVSYYQNTFICPFFAPCIIFFKMLLLFALLFFNFPSSILFYLNFVIRPQFFNVTQLFIFIFNISTSLKLIYLCHLIFFSLYLTLITLFFFTSHFFSSVI